MSKSEIEKIKAVLSEINKRNVEKLISTNGNNYSMIKILSNPDITNITKALEIAVDYIHDNYNNPAAQKALKQISEILEVK